jgi:hypothetical protein
MNATAYGFNGVFTKNQDGNAVLKNSISLYSPSGIYLGNDKINDTTFSKIFKFGSNAMVVAQILGI